jgi:hypothetical protein
MNAVPARQEAKNQGFEPIEPPSTRATVANATRFSAATGTTRWSG